MTRSPRSRTWPTAICFLATATCAPIASAQNAAAPPAVEAARMLRFPHMQGDKIAFVHGGDIWTASAHGGDARRVTSFDDGFELYPRISPDGNWIAFSGEYSGTRQIHLVPYAGGEPRQLTFYPDVGPLPPRGGYDHLPIDWTPDGSHILIQANRTPYSERIARYYLVDPWNGGIETPLQIPEGGPASYSPDGTKLAYNIISREWRTWKRYRAGRAQDVWIYDLTADSIERVTDYEGTDSFPMWLGDRIYFTSDRSEGTLNLFAFDVGARTTRQITTFRDFDVLFPSRGRGGVIFESGGYLHVMDEATEQVRKLDIRLADDRPWLRPTWKDGSERFGAYAPSPTGKRALVEFRGEIFSAPAERGEVQNLTRTPNRRERDPRWSPDASRVSYLAEAGDRYELFVRDLGDSSERQLTRDSGAWILEHAWSPDGTRIGFTDKANRLVVVDVASGEPTEIDRSAEGGITQWSFSADGGWLTYAKTASNGFDSVWLSNVGAPRPVQVTSDEFEDGSPCFDPKGRYLYFSSERDWRQSELDFELRVYALMLRADVPSPLAFVDDVEPKAAAATTKEATDESKPSDDAAPNPDVATPLVIDLDGLAERLVVLPGEPGDYGVLTGVDDGLLFVRDGDLCHYDLDERESEVVLAKVRDFALTGDRKRLFYRHQNGLFTAKPAAGQKVGDDDSAVPLSGVRVRIAPNSEWRQMFGDAWRIMREWFYDPGMHAYDWHALRQKYEPLVAHCSHRSDLDFLIGEIIGELNCGHTYVVSGELPTVERVPIGLLGCEYEQVGDFYRITKIFPGENWEERTRSPLTEPGVDVKVGDYVLAIDGRELRAPRSPYQALENMVGRHVELRVHDRPSDDGARTVVVRPIGSEVELRYLDWVRDNRARVAELSNGRIGYVHVPNTAVPGHRELFEGFRPQARTAAAMIIDDRYNGGGFIPDRMVFSLAQPVLNYWARRDTQLSTTPQYGFDGPMAMLINGYSSSGGDAFPFYFRKLGRGPLIGKKTWGGLVGYSGSPRLLDGGGLAVPSFAFVNKDGEWDVEAVGVAPDIEVFDDPTEIVRGRQPILDAAVRQLLEALESAPPPARPSPPAGPDRRR